MSDDERPRDAQRREADAYLRDAWAKFGRDEINREALDIALAAWAVTKPTTKR
jgi:hypothetical protein